MNKRVYHSPKIVSVYVQVEECIATGSTETFYVTPAEVNTGISNYDTVQEIEKDFNINL